MMPASFVTGRLFESDRKILLEINYHSDDDTGMYKVGEIDFGIYGTLEKYLQNYGVKGKNDIIETLKFLIKEVEKRSESSLYYLGLQQLKLRKNYL